MSVKEVSTNSLKIDRLRHRVLEGNIKVPPFQRDFVWQPDQILSLLDSIYNDYPIGSILLWETNEELPSKRDLGGLVLPEASEDYPVNYVLDGQQRLTTLFCSTCDINEFNKIESYELSGIFSVYFDIALEEFTFLQENESRDLIPISILFDNSKFVEFLTSEKREEGVTKLLTNLQSKFQNYEVPIVTVKKRTFTEVGIIFERVNNTGTNLTPLELMSAWTWSEDFDLKEKISEIFELLEENNFSNVKEKIILQCLSASIKKTTSIKSILTLTPIEVRDNIENVKDALKSTLDILQTEFNIETEDFLPRAHIIVPICYLFTQLKAINGDQTKILKKWFWRVSFSNRYASGTDALLDEDIKLMDKLKAKEPINLDSYKVIVTPEKLVKQKFIKSNTITKSFLLLLASRSPLDLTNGRLVDIGKAISSYNRKEYHHVFPKAYLKSKDYKDKEINSLCNFCLLPASSNKIISDDFPSNYFKNKVYSDGKENILNSNLLFEDSSIENDNYEEFLIKRSKLIMEMINQLI